jgi:hypothetical protein
MERAYMSVWIDHSAARVLELADGRPPKFTTYVSEAEGNRRSAGQTGGSPPGHVGEGTERRDRNRREEQLERFYDLVLERLLKADAILVIGPGEAKRELLGRMERTNALRAGVLQTETASRLTDGQMLARLRRFADLNPGSSSRPWLSG